MSDLRQPSSRIDFFEPSSDSLYRSSEIADKMSKNGLKLREGIVDRENRRWLVSTGNWEKEVGKAGLGCYELAI